MRQGTRVQCRLRSAVRTVLWSGGVNDGCPGCRAKQTNHRHGLLAECSDPSCRTARLPSAASGVMANVVGACCTLPAAACPGCVLGFDFACVPVSPLRSSDCPRHSATTLGVAPPPEWPATASRSRRLGLRSGPGSMTAPPILETAPEMAVASLMEGGCWVGLLVLAVVRGVLDC